MVPAISAGSSYRYGDRLRNSEDTLGMEMPLQDQKIYPQKSYKLRTNRRCAPAIGPPSGLNQATCFASYFSGFNAKASSFNTTASI